METFYALLALYFVRGIHQSPVNSPHKGQWCRALMFSLICAWTTGSICLWFEMPWRSLWHHCNDCDYKRLDYYQQILISDKYEAISWRDLVAISQWVLELIIEFCETSLHRNHNFDEPIRSEIPKRHDSWAVMKFAKLWTGGGHTKVNVITFTLNLMTFGQM